MAPVQSQSVLLANGVAHIGNGKMIPKSLIGFKDGKIDGVYNANVVQIEHLKYDTVIDVSGKHVYPGFIAVNSNLGLREIDQVRATHDFRETGKINPNVRSIVAYNTDSRITPTVRSNGVLLAQIVPEGGIISGMSSVVELDGWTWEEAVIREDDGIHLNWPNFRLVDPNEQREKKKKDSSEVIRMKKIEEIREFFRDAKAYLESGFNVETNLRYEAMKGIFNGQKNLYIHADHIRELTEAVDFKREFDLSSVVMVGCADAWRIPEIFADNDIPIILRRIHSLPVRSDEDIDLPFRIPQILDEAGILFCLNNSGRMEVMETRNLPFHAGTARAYGLDGEKAIQSITLNPAKILGIDDRVGSLEEGKAATIVVSSGDALDMRTNNIELAFIQGRLINLNNHQKELYKKYSEKYLRED